MMSKARRFTALAAAGILAVPLTALAHGGMMGGGMSSGTGMGMAAPAVAADGSVLVLEGFGMGSMMWDDERAEPALVNLSPAGVERWRATFDEGWPMMVSTEADLVVVTLGGHAAMGWGGSGDDGDTGGMGGGDHGGMGGGGHGGMGGHGMTFGTRDLPLSGNAALVALDLATGLERWRFTSDEAWMLSATISEDGTMVYVVAHGMGSAAGGSPMHQGGAWSGATATLYAIDALTGDVLWTRVLSGGGEEG